jgi:subtilase family serine protease
MKRIALIVVLILALAALLIPALPVAAENGPAAQTTFRVHGGPKAYYSTPAGYTPTQIRHAYGIDNLLAAGILGGGQTIAIVDAYGSPSIVNDLNTFDNQFGLATANLTVVMPHYTSNTDSGWALETSLDVEWAHALAPASPILLVEAKDASFNELFYAINYATQHAKVVSMSWGTGDFVGESAWDTYFNNSGVVYTASSGDTGGLVNYPSSSPYVLSVGGTTLPLDSSGNLTGTETGWSGSGGGISSGELAPGYQSGYSIPYSGGRATPDVSFDADPNTGVAVYDSTPYGGSSGWWQVGGTSLSSPCWAAIIALADQNAATPLSNNNLISSPIYNAAKGASYAANYRDIKSGNAGSYAAAPGYDLVTGLGSPLTDKLVPYLVNPVSTPDFSLSVTPASQTVIHGNGTGYTVTATPSGGFSGLVGLSVSGATGTFSPVSITGAGSSTLSVTTSSTMPVGNYTLTITGTSGSLTHTITATLVVTGATPSLSVNVSTNSGSYAKNSTITVNVTVTSSGPVGGAAVTLTIKSPSGGTVFNQSGTAASNGTATFTYRLSRRAASGIYAVKATASAGGYNSGSGSTTFTVQ